ncbi:ImuA family protein [Pseudorhodoplanes sp.]|uniref:ImuA family protein n=1 Tax=Pseudorhodoplanes sp. TaxID=1934341 RepID=UPI003918795D
MDALMAGAQAPDALARLRQDIENIQHYQSDNAPLPLGLRRADALLRGGLARSVLHDIAPAAPIHLGAATGFALAIAALSYKAAGRSGAGGRETVLIQTDMARWEAGAAYGIGLGLFGQPVRRLLVLRARRPIDALFAMEEALKCRAVSAVIAEMPDDTADLTATRRLSLAARTHDGIGLLLRHRMAAQPSAAVTRWDVAALGGERDPFGGLGTTGFQLSLVKNRRGPCGAFRVAWSHHELAFVETDPVAVAAPAFDRPADAAIA